MIKFLAKMSQSYTKKSIALEFCADSFDTAYAFAETLLPISTKEWCDSNDSETIADWGVDSVEEKK